MNRMETELKFAVPAPPALRRRMRALGFRVVRTRRRECNWIFDTSGGDLRRSGRLLRLRRSGRLWTLTAKGPRRDSGMQGGKASALSALKQRPEIETEVADGVACRGMLELLGYRVQLVYERHRTVYRRTGEAGELAWDETPFGVYLEIEGAPAWVRRTARELALDAANAEPRSYPELYREHAAASRPSFL